MAAFLGAPAVAADAHEITFGDLSFGFIETALGDQSAHVCFLAFAGAMIEVKELLVPFLADTPAVGASTHPTDLVSDSEVPAPGAPHTPNSRAAMLTSTTLRT